MLDHYLRLPYTVKVDYDGEACEAWIAELPHCRASARKDESVEELFGRLHREKQRWIQQSLSRGEEIPEPPKPDPFWREFDPEGHLDASEVTDLIYNEGASLFPLRVLEKFWLKELEKVRLFEEEAPWDPPAKGQSHNDPVAGRPEGEAYPVRLGEAGKWAWVRVDGPRTKWGFKEIEVLDEPLETEMAITTAMTILGASEVSEEDLKPLREALSEYVKAHPEETEGKSLKEVYDELLARRSTAEDPGRSRNPYYPRSFAYSLALLRCRRPGFDGLPFKEQLGLAIKHHYYINGVLKAAKNHGAFLEYGTPEGIPKRTVTKAQIQVEAAVLADVCGMNDRQIAQELGVELTEKDELAYKTKHWIPKIQRRVEAGQRILDDVPGTTGWRERAEAMRVEVERWRRLRRDEKVAQLKADDLGIPVESLRTSEGWALTSWDRRWYLVAD